MEWCIQCQSPIEEEMAKLGTIPEISEVYPK